MKDKAWLNIDKYDCNSSMGNPTCDTATTIIWKQRAELSFDNVLRIVQCIICNKKTVQVEQAYQEMFTLPILQQKFVKDILISYFSDSQNLTFYLP
jgi:hypothetical protein